MRTVPGPTDSVVIVGAGLGGLSAALRLAGAGRRVTVLEREPVPG
jgi:phytoene desaturase